MNTPLLKKDSTFCVSKIEYSVFDIVDDNGIQVYVIHFNGNDGFKRYLADSTVELDKEINNRPDVYKNVKYKRNRHETGRLHQIKSTGFNP